MIRRPPRSPLFPSPPLFRPGPAFTAQDLAVDERLREKELGLFYRLTRVGIEQRHPEQWALRKLVGPFYYRPDRKSTRLNSSHANISYAVFCLKKKHTVLSFK